MANMDTGRLSDVPLPQRGLLHGPGEGVELQFGPSEQLVWKATGATTQGVLDTAELKALPQASAPEHIHHWNDESFYILEGTFRIKVGERWIDAPAGTFAFVPRGTAHAWLNVGAEPGRILLVFTPGGAHHYFEDLAPLLDGLVDPERLLPILHKHGVELVRPLPTQ